MSNLKRFLSLTLAMLMVVGAMATVSAKSFTDVAATDPYAEAVDVLSELGVIAGATTTEFAPDALVERQQMAMFIARLATAQPTWFEVAAPAVFADQTAPVYNAAIAFASTNGFVKGTSTTTYNGAASVTLQEAATMLCRVLGYTTPEMDTAYPFSYLTMADDIGLLAGLEDVAPTAALTRGEVAIMLYNAFKAPMANKTVVYGTTGVPTFVVTIPDLDDAKTLMVSKWKVDKISSSITATKDFGFIISKQFPTKLIADPIILDDVNLADANVLTSERILSFATIAKFFPEDANANDYLGVDLNVFTKNGKVISIDVIGDVKTTADATIADGVVTVDGTAYNLATYPGAYPSIGDNCFYKYNGDNKIVATNLEGLALISNGFFTMDIINEGRDTQKIIFKPLTLAKVLADGADADTTLEIGAVGRNITSNTVNAVADDYVTYFFGGSNLVEIVDVATKSEALTIKSVKTSASSVIMNDGTVVKSEGADAVITGSLTNIPLTINSNTYYLYTVGGKVVYVADGTVTPTGPVHSNYSTVVAIGANITIDGDPIFGTASTTTGYAVKVVDAAGVESTIKLTHINGVEINATDATATPAVTFNIVGTEAFDKTDWPDDVGELVDTDPSSLYAALIGEAVVVDGTKIITTVGTGFKDALDTYVSTLPDVEDSNFTRNSTGVYTLPDPVGKFVLTNETKIVVKASDGYKVLTGKAFTELSDTATLTDLNVVYYNNNGVKELLYLFANTDAAKDAVLAGPAADETVDLYVFTSVDTISATSIVYNAIQLKTGEAKQLTFNNAADVTTVPVPVETGKLSVVYNLQAGQNTPDDWANVTDESIVKLTSTGYLSVDGEAYSTVDTKYYVWNSDAAVLKYEFKSSIEVNTAYTAIVVTNEGNADYVIVRGAAATVAEVIANPVAGEVESGTDIALTTATPGATIYYTTNGDAPTTESIEYTGVINLTTDTTIKAIAVKAGCFDSAVATFIYTIE